MDKSSGGDLLREFQRLKQKPVDEFKGGNNSSLSQEIMVAAK